MVPYTTEEEYQLYCRALEFEEQFFDDMTRREGNTLQAISETLDEGGVACGVLPDSDKVAYHVDDLGEGVCGQYNRETHTITISRRYLNDDSALLHEMIHYFEDSLKGINPAICELLLIDLYSKLSARIPDLRARMLDHAELTGLRELENSGGEHGMLFFLKSLDLDLRCGYHLGKVLGYGKPGNEQ